MKKIPLTGRGWNRDSKAAAKAINRLITFHGRWHKKETNPLEWEEFEALIKNTARDLWIEELLEKSQGSPNDSP